jgi:glycosyltransferase involved in cell wall biosynthesis
MHVAIFTDNDFDKVNGVTTTLSAALAHAPAGMRLRVYTAATLGVDDPQYLALRAVGMPIPFYGEMRMYIPPWRKLLDHARRDGTDLIHLTTPGPMGLAAMYVASRLKLPMVGSFHTDLAAYTATLSGSARLGALMREYMRWPYGKCARVLVPSEATKQTLVGAKGNPAKMAIWTRGVDTDLFSPAKRSPRLRDEWHVSDRRPALLFVGRVSREKGLDLLAPISRRLHAMGLEHRWIIAGQGPMSAELRAALPDAVFTGVLSRPAVAEAFASADLFVFPSRTDTAGNVVLEAQASGLPVVVSDVGGPKENMVDGRTGTVCQGTEPGTWAQAIVDLLRNRPEGAAKPAAAREYAVTRQWSTALEPL